MDEASEADRLVPESGLGLSDLERLTGYRIKEVPYQEWRERADRLDEEDRQRGIDPDMDLEALKLDWPASTEWIESDGKARYTDEIHGCYGGIVVDQKGRVRIFHFLENWTRKAPDLLKRGLTHQDRIVGGFVGGEDFLGDPEREVYVEELGLMPIIPDKKDSDSSLNVLVDPKEKEVLWAFDYSTDSKTASVL